MKQKYIKSPSEVLAENEIDLAKANHTGASNPWVLGLQGLGGMMMNTGMNMTNNALGSGENFGDLFKNAPTAAYGANVGGPGDKKKKGKKDKPLTEADAKSVNESDGLAFNAEMANSWLEKITPKEPAPAPSLDFGKLKDVKYFDIVGNEGDAIVIQNTKNNPHNGHTIKQNMDYLRELNPEKDIKLKFMAYGGQVEGDVPVEAEGGEVLTTVEGESAELKGPKHKDGGIDLMLGMGDKIFSDRITKEGKTMAERETARQKNITKLEKMLEKTPGDAVLKKSMKRTAENNAAEEESDLAAQQAVRQVMELANPPKDLKAPWGFDPTMLMGALQGMGASLPDFASLFSGTSDNMHTGDPAKDYGTSSADMDFEPQIGDIEMEFLDTEEKEGFGVDDILGGMSAGDVMGMAGNLYSGVAPMMHTKNTRAKDTPNVNHYENFGEEGLETIDETKEFASQNNDRLKTDIAKNTNAAKRSGRVGARGVNTQRAMDLAVEQGSNNALSSASNNFASQMMQILGKEGQMENIQDQVVMGGEESRDMKDRADKDNHATQMAQNIVGMGESVQQMGKDMNNVKQNEIIMKMLSQLSNYGLGFDKGLNVTKNN